MIMYIHLLCSQKLKCQQLIFSSFNICWHVDIYEHDKIRDQLSWACTNTNKQTPMAWIHCYTTFTNFSTNYLVMCKVYTDVGGIK